MRYRHKPDSLPVSPLPCLRGLAEIFTNSLVILIYICLSSFESSFSALLATFIDHIIYQDLSLHPQGF